MDFRFEEIQSLRWVVYDVDNRLRIDDPSKQELIGSMECSLANIVTGGRAYTRSLRAGGYNKRGTITVQAEEVQDSKFSITMQLAANKLDKKDLFGKVATPLTPSPHHPITPSPHHILLPHTPTSLPLFQSDPFFEIAKAQEGGAFTVVYRSQPVMKNLNPK